MATLGLDDSQFRQGLSEAENTAGIFGGSIGNVISQMAGGVGSALGEMGNTVSGIWKSLTDGTGSAWETIKGILTGNASGASESVGSSFGSMGDSSVGTFSSMSQSLGNLGEQLQSNLGGIFQRMQGDMTNPMNGAKTSVLDVFMSIGQGIKEKMDGASGTVSSTIEAIKQKFNFSWSLPHLKLPHPSVSGSFSLNPPSVPHFSIAWYKKAMDNAILLDSPTIFGMSGGRLLGGGEAGEEVVSGAGTLMDMIRGAVRAELGDMTRQMESLNGTVSGYFPQVLKAMDRKIVLDTGVMVGGMAAEMDEALGRLALSRRRGG